MQQSPPKDLPEPLPLPSQFGEKFLHGLETQSGKIEFLPNTLKRVAENDESPVLNRYIPSWEGRQAKDLAARFPIQMLTTHPRYSFHTYNDGKDSTTNDIAEHRVLIDGYYYWVMRIALADAEARAIKQHDLICIFNERGSVICAADVSALMAGGVCKAYESCANLDLIDHPTLGRVDRAGALNLLTPPRVQVKGTSGMATNSCLIEFEKWTDTAAFGLAAE